MASCAPPCSGSPSATTFSVWLSIRCGGHRSKSRTITFVRTRAPASQHTRAAALSSTNPLLPRTPATAQAARWWPRLSRGRQLRIDRGGGRWTRRSIKTRKGWGSNVVALVVGNATKGVDENGPDWDLNNALFSTGREGINTFSRKSSCKLSAVSFCQPKRGWIWSSSSISGLPGRKTSDKFCLMQVRAHSNSARRCPCVPLLRLRAFHEFTRQRKSAWGKWWRTPAPSPPLNELQRNIRTQCTEDPSGNKRSGNDKFNPAFTRRGWVGYRRKFVS